VRSIKIENLVFKESFETHSLNSHMSSRSARACGRCGLPMKHPTYTSENGEKAILTGFQIENHPEDIPYLTEESFERALSNNTEEEVVLKADKDEFREEWEIYGFLSLWFADKIEYCFKTDGTLYPRGSENKKLPRLVYPTIFWVNWNKQIHTAWVHEEDNGDFYLVIRKGAWKRNGPYGVMRKVYE
jgi:hypothetical protein